MYNTWTEEQLKSRYSVVSNSYLETTKDVLPKLERLSKLETEIFEIALELKSRGVDIETTEKPRRTS